MAARGHRAVCAWRRRRRSACPESGRKWVQASRPTRARVARSRTAGCCVQLRPDTDGPLRVGGAAPRGRASCPCPCSRLWTRRSLPCPQKVRAMPSRGMGRTSAGMRPGASPGSCWGRRGCPCRAAPRAETPSPAASTALPHSSVRPPQQTTARWPWPEGFTSETRSPANSVPPSLTKLLRNANIRCAGSTQLRPCRTRSAGNFGPKDLGQHAFKFAESTEAGACRPRFQPGAFR